MRNNILKNDDSENSVDWHVGKLTPQDKYVLDEFLLKVNSYYQKFIDKLS